MASTDLASARSSVPLAPLVTLLAATGVLGASSVLLTPSGSTVAAWWPASGTAAIALLLAGRRLWAVGLILVAVGMLSNVVGGRAALISLVFGTITATESVIFVLALTHWLPSRQLRTVADVLKLFVAAAISSLALGVLAAAAVGVFLGGDPVRTFFEVTPSHFSALVVIVPLVLITWRWEVAHIRELIIQAPLLIGVVLLVFWPGHFLPLAFLPLPVICWAAIRFGFTVVAVELAAVGIISLGLTLAGGGPFASTDDPGKFTTTLIQIFFLSYSSSVLLLAAVAAERGDALMAAQSSEAMLRDGLGAAQIGLMIIRGTGRDLEVVDANPAAFSLLAEVEGHKVIADPDLADGIRSFRDSAEDNWSGEWDAADGSRLQAFARMTDRGRMSVQVVDITARHHAELATAAALTTELAAAEALRALKEWQDEFVSSVTQALRTPLSSVIGFTQEIERSSLNSLVDDLLTLAALDQGEVPVQQKPAALAILVQESVEQLHVQATADRVTLVFAGDSKVEAQTAHPREVRQILANILNNAVKFTPPGGDATVLLAVTQRDAVVTVTDSGRGIPPAELDAVFQRFVRSSRSAATTGTGLGLPIVRKMLDNMGGTIVLESDGAHGTTVRMTLPILGVTHKRGASES